MQLHVVKDTNSSRDEFGFIHGMQSISFCTTLMLVGNAKLVKAILSLSVPRNFEWKFTC